MEGRPPSLPKVEGGVTSESPKAGVETSESPKAGGETSESPNYNFIL